MSGKSHLATTATQTLQIQMFYQLLIYSEA